jgi:hypothetical protein
MVYLRMNDVPVPAVYGPSWMISGLAKFVQDRM